MSQLPILPPFIPNRTRVANLVPFTYRDSMTLLEKIENLQKYVTAFVPEVNAAVAILVAEFEAINETQLVEFDTRFTDFVDHINALVALINNKTGPVDTQHITLTANRTLSVDALFPDNHAIVYEIEQTGAYTLTPTGNLAGTILMGTEPGTRTVFFAIPKQVAPGEPGQWFVYQARQETQEMLLPIVEMIDLLGAQLQGEIDALTSQLNGRLSDSTLDDRYALRVDVADLRSKAVLKNELVINARDYGAKGDGIADDSESLVTALMAAKGKTLLIPPGNYNVKTYLEIQEGTTVMGYGATLTRDDFYGLRITNYPYGDLVTSGYKGFGNINVFGLTIDSAADVMPEGPHNTMSMVHAENILIQDVTFLNSIGHHTLELNAIKNGRVINCNFLGHLAVSGLGNNEALQIDVANGNQSGLADNTPCVDILVQGCTFKGYKDIPAAAVGVGAHAKPTAGYYKNIQIVNNVFEGQSRAAIAPFFFEDSVISGNTITGESKSLSGRIGIWSRASNRLTIANNVLKNVYDGISLSQFEADAGSSCNITGNIIEDAYQGIYIGNNAMSCLVSSNVLFRITTYAITIYGALYAHVANNVIYGAGYPNGAAGAIRVNNADTRSPSIIGNRGIKHSVGGGIEVSAGISIDVSVPANQTNVYANDFYGLGSANIISGSATQINNRG